MRKIKRWYEKRKIFKNKKIGKCVWLKFNVSINITDSTVSQIINSDDIYIYIYLHLVTKNNFTILNFLLKLLNVKCTYKKLRITFCV